MTEARAWAAAAYHPDVGFLITGGNGPLSSTEVTTDGTNFQVDGVFSREAEGRAAGILILRCTYSPNSSDTEAGHCLEKCPTPSMDLNFQKSCVAGLYLPSDLRFCSIGRAAFSGAAVSFHDPENYTALW